MARKTSLGVEEMTFVGITGKPGEIVFKKARWNKNYSIKARIESPVPQVEEVQVGERRYVAIILKTCLSSSSYQARPLSVSSTTCKVLAVGTYLGDE